MIYKVDAVVLGGGIAGLSTLATLKRAGYCAVLLEKDALGSGQTLKSQGIIHGGTKYALRGHATAAQRQIAAMPDYWRKALRGQGEWDLSACRVLTEHQCLWAMPTVSSQITGFFASRAMQSHVARLTDKPSALQHPACKGRFYALDEPVLDVHSLLVTFSQLLAGSILTDCQLDIAGQRVTAECAGQRWQFQAERIIFTAGQGNASCAPFAQQQLRPLRMFYARVPKSFGRLFVHVLGASDKPRLTVSTHDSPHADEWVWYLGGHLAETAVELSAQASIVRARAELGAIFPWLPTQAIALDSFTVNRAEGLAGGKRPDAPIVVAHGKQVVAWPTKLALAPLLAEAVLARLPAPRGKTFLPAFPAPRIAELPWQVRGCDF